MIKKKVERLEDGTISTYFEGEEHSSEKTMRAWFKRLIASHLWTVTGGGVRECDDYDAPVQKNFDYESADAIKNDMDHINNMDLESFHLEGKYRGKKVMFSTSIFSKKHAYVDAPDGFDPEVFLKKMHIE